MHRIEPKSLPRFSPSARSDVEPFRAMELVARAGAMSAAGESVILMCVGQPGAPAPSAARKAAARALEIGRIGYTPAPGIAPLRKRIAQWYGERYAAECDPGRVFVTTGSSAGFILSFLACFEAGDRVAIPAPGYPAYRNILRALSLEPVEIFTRPEDRWVVTPELLAETHAQAPLAGVLIANPNNPNGTMMKPDAFSDLVAKCGELGIRFISDEIYHGLTYGMEEVTALPLDPDAFIINSFSKYFCMTGWRIGWMVVPENMIGVIDRLQQNAFICAPEISQIAALAAFEGVDEMNAVSAGYAENRNLFTRRLTELGFASVQPVDGAFYAYADASPHTDDTSVFASRLLEEAKVAVTPGLDFDTRRGRHWLRFSFCGDHADMVEGFNRIEAWLK